MQPSDLVMEIFQTLAAQFYEVGCVTWNTIKRRLGRNPIGVFLTPVRFVTQLTCDGKCNTTQAVCGLWMGRKIKLSRCNIMQVRIQSHSGVQRVRMAIVSTYGKHSTSRTLQLHGSTLL